MGYRFHRSSCILAAQSMKHTQQGQSGTPKFTPSVAPPSFFPRSREMASAGCFACANSMLIFPPTKASAASPYFLIPKSKISFQNHSAHKPFTASSPSSKIQFFRVNAAGFNPSTKPNSIVCSDCDGNGAILCKQCKGTAVNSVDHFNGQFKAGELCWLCRGKRDILCGNCNGAGFIGGFMSTFDE